MKSGIYKKVVLSSFFCIFSFESFQIAIKVINKDKVTKDFRDKFLPCEIDCWRQLRHPNLVRILGHYEAMKYVFLSMEYGEKGDLLAFVQKNDPQPETGPHLAANDYSSRRLHALVSDSSSGPETGELYF